MTTRLENPYLTGVAAGAIGTAAMTASQAVEMKLTGREGSDVPGQVAEGLARAEVSDPQAKAALSLGTHWAHGFVGGGLRGAIGSAGVRGPAAAALLFAGLWTTDVTLYRALGIADYPWRWSKDALLTDLFHKGLYSAVTSAAYDRLTR